MNLNPFTRRTPSAPPVLSQRDRVAAELEYETALLPELELMVRFGKRQPEDLDAKRGHIEQLQKNLEIMTNAEAEDAKLTARQKTELPAEEAALTSELREFIKDVLRLRDRARAIVRKREAIEDRFGNHRRVDKAGHVLSVPLANHMLLSLISGFISDDLCDFQGPAARWLQEARQAGFEVPREAMPAARPARRHAELAKEMTSEERRVRRAVGSLS